MGKVKWFKRESGFLREREGKDMCGDLEKKGEGKGRGKVVKAIASTIAYTNYTTPLVFFKNIHNVNFAS